MLKYYCLFALGVLLACESNTNLKHARHEKIIENKKVDSLDLNSNLVNQKDVEEKKYNYFDDYFTITSKKELYQIFDSTALKDEEVWYAEGTVQKKSTILVNPITKHMINFIWTDDVSQQTEWLEANYWDFDELYQNNEGFKAKNGLYLGMPLKELEEWNEQQPIKFLGFGWDYSGAVIPDSTSKLGQSEIKINLGIGDTNDLSVFGDIELNSSNENIKELPIFINQLIYYNE